tara:strand:- start:9522 stop:9785 length:264 start_codon:yes stop_codon:yes gene_type:complete
MNSLEKLFLTFFISFVGYLLYKANHDLYNQKIVFYNCFDKTTQIKLFPMTEQEYTVLKNSIYPQNLTCTKAKYTKYYVRLLKGPYKK